MISQLFAFYLTDKHGERFCSILTNALTSNTWKVQLVVLSAIKLFIERLVIILHSESSNFKVTYLINSH